MRYILRNKKNYEQKASTLILALWILSFLAVFAVGLAHNVSSQLRLASYFQDRLKTRALAYAGVQRAIIQLILAKDETPNYDSFADEWLSSEETYKEIPLGDGYFSIGYSVGKGGEEQLGEDMYGLMDESNKININRASVNVLKALLENAGKANPEEAADIANAIVDWRDKDVFVSPGGAEDSQYAMGEFPYPCKDDDFQVIEELLLVKGMTPEIFNRLKDVITVYGSGRININTVSARSLMALGISESLAQRIVDHRRGADNIEGTEDDNIFESVGDIGKVGSLFTQEAEDVSRLTSLNALTVKSDVFRICSTGILKKGSYEARGRIICVVERKKNEPPSILYWHEE
ncbi:MAG: general secretion pathway protein GspK [Candidatus Omnitrophica bacterium]|nr:general secretion pathway protein GspK [Candidatus Omnitrophota bacterium]